MTDLSLERRSDKGQGLFKDMTKTRKAKVDVKPTRPSINVSDHGRYQIKSGRLAGKFTARAFAKPPTKARGLIAEASGPTEEAAITALHAVIDTRETLRIQDRRKDPRTEKSVPSVEEFTEALCHVALTQPQRTMLIALSLASADGLTDLQLANGPAYTSAASANRSLASAGRLISNYLGFEDNSKVPRNSSEAGSILVFRGEPQDETDPGNWILFPELREAVKAIF